MQILTFTSPNNPPQRFTKHIPFVRIRLITYKVVKNTFFSDNGFSPDEPLDLVEEILLHGSTNTVSAINNILFDSSSQTARKAADIFSKPHSTLLITFRQRPLTTSSLLKLGRWLSLEISGIRDEIRLNVGEDLSEVLNYRLADGNLHRLALSFSPNHVEMRVNCSVVYRRPTSFSSLISIYNSNYPNLRIAQYFKVSTLFICLFMKKITDALKNYVLSVRVI